jgi:putative addiction module component (TIGR02574 family)
MKPEQIKLEVEQLDLSQKLLLVEDIWDSIAESNSVLPMPTWQKKELDDRYEAYKNGELELYSLDEINTNARKIINES